MKQSKRERLPNKRPGLRITIGEGARGPHSLQLHTGEFPDGTLGEIFLDSSKEGSFSRALLNAFAMSVSLGLQHGVPLSAFTHTFREFKMEPDLIRQIFQELEDFYTKEKV